MPPARRVPSPVEPDLAELALWYHDAVYVATAHDNEERSAALLLEDASALGLGPVAREAADCVRATAHLAGVVPEGSASELVVDIDLSILGREPLRFMDYEYAIADEYASVGWTRYVLGRARFLNALLERPSIFRTPALAERYEQSARRNIAALLASKRYSCARRFGWLARFFG